jgi:transposase-like protein
MAAKLSVREFFARFPTDDACLEHLMEVRYGLRHACAACNKDKPEAERREWTFHRLGDRKAFSCANCGTHIYPQAGTIFQDSRTSLQLWFYAIFLFVTTRHGVSGMEIHRVLGVTKKTGWRIGHQIRKLMIKADGFEVMQGHVEADESYMGGVRRGTGTTGRGTIGKTIVMGIKERGGRMHAQVIPDVKTGTLRSVILKHVQLGSTVSTDELGSYSLLGTTGYKQGRVKHSKMEWVRTDDGVSHHVNHVESFWRLFKNSVRSTHIHVSPKYMDRYLKEFTFRANHREMQNAMFDLLVAAV